MHFAEVIVKEIKFYTERRTAALRKTTFLYVLSFEHRTMKI
jgi:hypothetical protein